MTEILITALLLVALLAGFAELVRLARRDRFAGPGIGHLDHDELGPFAGARRPL